MSTPSPLEAIFFGALQQGSPTERAAYLDQACAGNRDLRERLEKMLAAQAQAGSFLEVPAVELGKTVDQPLSERPGTQIGPYKLLQEIGHGGMGVVYMAEQLEPVRRKVALKIIKPGMDTRQVIARFEAERQALSLMDHPNIAKVLDAGATESGRPYFVMELVKGQPITEYCDEKHLTPRERLELLLPVCQAIQHAHQKGIIHRDIKPSNILVAEYDEKPIPKVIDFGVAKAISQPLTEKTMFTGLGQIVGTLEYMSPEQAKVNQLDIDTRSDIYSIGVLMYELLTGSTPFDRERLRSAAWDEMLRIIREEEPPRPSTKLSSSDSLPSVSANRSMEPTRLSRTVRGELDWIVMKALEKDRNRRYETANGLAMDIQRYLADEPVLACPPSVAYRAKKFARRNKGGLAVAALVLFFLVLLGSGVGWAVRDQAARQSRIGAQVDLVLGEVEQLTNEEKWPDALAVARRAEALTAGGADGATQERVRQVLNDLQIVARLDELRLREAHANASIDEGLSDLYAAAFRDFGVDVDALPAEESTARLRTRPAVAIALAAALDDWARVRRPQDGEQSKRLWALATALDSDPWRVQVRRASAAMDVAALVKLANAPEVALQPPQSQLLLASSLRRGDQLEQAQALLERACESHPGDFWIHYVLAGNSTIRPDRTSRHDRIEAGVRHGIAARALRPRSAYTWNVLGVTLHRQKKLDEAVAAYRKAIELDPKYAQAYSNLGIVLYDQKKLDEAVAPSRKAIELDPKYAQGYSNLGAILCDDVGGYDKAIECYRKAIELDPKNVLAHHGLSTALRKQKKVAEAADACQQAIEIDPDNADSYIILGIVLTEQQKLDDAITAYRKAIQLDPANAKAHGLLGIALERQGKPNEAIAACRTAIEIDPSLFSVHHSLGNSLHELKEYDKAIEHFKRAIELQPAFASAYNNLGNALMEQGKVNDAIAAYRKAIELDPKYATAQRNLGIAFNRQNEFAKAVACFGKAIELDPSNVGSHYNLGLAYHQLKERDKAIACFQKATELDPSNPLCSHALGNALRDRKKPKEATAAFRRTIEIDPQFTPAYINLGSLLCDDLEDYAAASECFRQAIELEPKSALAHDYLGIALRRLKRLDEAAVSFRKAIELDPHFTNAYSQLGDLLRKQNKFKEAIAALTEAINLEPQRKENWDNRAHVFVAFGKWNRAAADFARCTELAPDSYSSWRWAAYAHLAAGDMEGYQLCCGELLARFGKTDDLLTAERTAKICALAPGAAADFAAVERLAQFVVTGTEKRSSYERFAFAKGLTEYRAGNYEEAIKWMKLYRPKPEGTQGSAMTFASLAMAQHRLGRTDEARAALANAKAILAEKQPEPGKGRLYEDRWHDWLDAQILSREAEKVLMEHAGVETRQPEPKPN